MPNPPNPIQGWPSPENYGDLDLYDAYTSAGGSMSWTEWLNAGKPTSDDPVVQSRAWEQKQKADQEQLDYDAYVAASDENKATAKSFTEWLKAGKPQAEAKPTPPPVSYPPPPGFPETITSGGKTKKWNPWTGEYMEVGDAPKKGEHYTETDKYGQEWDVTVDPDGTITKRRIAPPPKEKRTRPPGSPDTFTDRHGNVYTWTDEEGYQITGYDQSKDTNLNPPAKGKTPLPPGQDQTFTDYDGKIWTWDENTGDYNQTGYDPEKDLNKKARDKDKADAAAAAKERLDFEQGQAGIQSRQWETSFAYGQQQDAARMAAEKESRLANLRASPASWLQYSLEANQTPVIQPWQKPLMPQQYGNLNVGQPIPGWQGLNQGQANLPELTTPSTQYFSRIGPTAQQQWGGYQQMQSGAPLEESFWRLGQQTAPGGRNPGLSWLR